MKRHFSLSPFSVLSLGFSFQNLPAQLEVTGAQSNRGEEERTWHRKEEEEGKKFLLFPLSPATIQAREEEEEGSHLGWQREEGEEESGGREKMKSIVTLFLVLSLYVQEGRKGEGNPNFFPFAAYDTKEAAAKEDLFSSLSPASSIGGKLRREPTFATAVSPFPDVMTPWMIFILLLRQADDYKRKSPVGS